jgi:hypothetical protein
MAKNPTYEFEFKAPTYLRISKIIAYIMYVWVMIGVVLLGLRVFLLLTSANAATPFVEFVYRTSADYMNPFRGIFPVKPVTETGYLDSMYKPKLTKISTNSFC